MQSFPERLQNFSKKFIEAILFLDLGDHFETLAIIVNFGLFVRFSERLFCCYIAAFACFTYILLFKAIPLLLVDFVQRCVYIGVLGSRL